MIRSLTLHPEGKKGVNIDKAKYEQIKDKIIDILAHENELTFTRLGNEVDKQLSKQFEGSISWYNTTVKLDLEARGIISRVQGSKPQRIELKRKLNESHHTSEWGLKHLIDHS